jgi:fructose-bisphosphate aldolase class II
VWTRVHREHLRDHTENFDFRKPGEAYVKAYAQFIVEKSEKLLSANTLDQIQASLLVPA